MKKIENNNNINSEEEFQNQNVEEGSPEEQIEDNEILDDNYILQLHQH